MNREDFVFTVGFEGSTAFVDGKAKRRYSKLSTIELIDKGLFKAAFCSALYDSDDGAIRRLLETYNAEHGAAYENAEQLKRLFGVDAVPENVGKVKTL